MFPGPQLTGRQGEVSARSWLLSRGLKAELVDHYNTPYDLLCEGRRIEVKTASMTTKKCGQYEYPVWRFNIHRHGKLNESHVDVYVLRLIGFPGMKNALYLIIPAPIERKTLQLTVRSLIGRHSHYVNNFDAIRPGMGRGAERLQ